jgi:uncharacterized membrane protein SirB2
MLSNNKKGYFRVQRELTILEHWCKIWPYFYDIMLILSKIHHFRFFNFFFTQITSYHF